MVNSFYPPYVGGAETYVSEVARGLSSRGHNVTVYCASNPLPPGESYEEGVRIRRMRSPARLYGTPLALSPVNIFSEHYDIIHCNFPSPYLAALFSWLSAVRRTPSVITWHNDLPRITSAAGLLVRAHDFLSPTYLGTFKRIIATTKIYAETSPILTHYRRKVRIIANGVDTVRFNPGNRGGSVKAEHHLEGCKVVLFVGALTTWHAYKGVDNLLRAFRLARDRFDRMKLVIVGGGSLAGEYVRLARELSLDHDVIFAGHSPDAELPSYYAACDVAVLPSKDRSEGYGLVLLEAMASGKPVICSNIGGLPEVVRHLETGLLVQPNDVQALADAIVSICKDDETRERMGKAARQFAEGRDWSAVAEKVEGVYKEISLEPVLT